MYSVPQVTLGGLLQSGRYTVRVAAETASGRGPLSVPLTFSLAAITTQPPAAGLLAIGWFQAALAALLAVMLLMMLAVLLICLYRRRRGRTLSRGESESAGLPTEVRVSQQGSQQR